MIYGCVPQNKGDILIFGANISSGYKIAVLLNRANNSLESRCLIEYRASDVRKKSLFEEQDLFYVAVYNVLVTEL